MEEIEAATLRIGGIFNANNTSINMVIIRTAFGIKHPYDYDNEHAVERVYRQPPRGIELAEHVPGRQYFSDDGYIIPWCRLFGGVWRMEKHEAYEWKLVKGLISDWQGLFPCCDWMLYEQRKPFCLPPPEGS